MTLTPREPASVPVSGMILVQQPPEIPASGDNQRQRYSYYDCENCHSCSPSGRSISQIVFRSSFAGGSRMSMKRRKG